MLYLRMCDCADKDDKGSAVRFEAHMLLRYALAENGILDERELKFARGEYGKPYLENNGSLHFNISHSRNLAVCAVAERPVGVDTELIRGFPERVMKRCFTEHEIESVNQSDFPETSFFQLWTLKESYIKAIGKGLSYPMKKAEFIIDNNNIMANTEENFSFAQIMLDNGYICSVCCKDIFENKVYYREFEDKISFESLNLYR
ncbi:MAG: 4'-phosphopantetheinyl transferase superfamily protein [Clostridium sp.]|nr:4'-phosphopantetheinyl transferase superfamily protein [Clostridium sp.]MCM1547697.1 4'-phosphopantetheinyl transferase superfamily protein [Ruminococcus sp.]